MLFVRQNFVHRLESLFQVLIQRLEAFVLVAEQVIEQAQGSVDDGRWAATQERPSTELYQSDSFRLVLHDLTTCLRMVNICQQFYRCHVEVVQRFSVFIFQVGLLDVADHTFVDQRIPVLCENVLCLGAFQR